MAQKRTMTASMGRAAEREWAQELVGVRKEVEREGENLKQHMAEIRNAYGDKTPTDIITSPQAALTEGRKLFVLFSKIQARIVALLKKDYAIEKKLKPRLATLFRQKGGHEYLMSEVIKKQAQIESELRLVVGYWEYVKNNGKLPGLVHIILHGFNSKRITHPFSVIEMREIGVLEDIDREISIIKAYE